MGSTRLPGKIFKLIGGKPAIKILTDAIGKTEFKNCLYILTSTNQADDIVENFAKREHIKCFRGKEKDVLDRFFQAACAYKISDIVRLTADCPFLSMKVLIQNINSYYQLNRPDYYFKKGYPRGIGDVELFTFSALAASHLEATEFYHREHVMTFIESRPEKFRAVIEEGEPKYMRPDIRLTLDEQADLDLLRQVYDKLAGKIDLERIIELFNQEPELILVNKNVKQKII